MMRLLVGMFCALLPWVAEAVEVKEVVTPQGFKAWLIEEHSLPIVTVELSFRHSGTAYDPDDKQGLAKFASLMLDAGAGELNEAAFSAALQEKAIQLSFGVNEDVLSADLQSLSEHRERAFMLLGEALTKTRLDMDALERNRADVLSDLMRYQADPGYVLDSATRRSIFGAHPYGRAAVGIAAGVEKIQHEDISAFIKNALAKDVLVISVAGDITPDELSRLLDLHLAALPQQSVQKPLAEAAPVFGKREAFALKIPQTLVRLAVPGIKRNQPEFFTAFVLNHIMGGGTLTSRISDELREKRGLAYYAYCELEPMLYAGTQGCSFATRNEQAVSAIKVAEELLAGFAAKGISDAELLAAQQYLVGSFPLKLDNNAALVNYLSIMQLSDLGKDYLDRRNDYVRAVTKEQVNALAAKLLVTKNITVVTAGNPK